ncbi:tail fiber domain-containing protein [Burkholderia gladioli]|uniref:tail fiber domain-containing protein n=1 Tax=Burkholderia gladioli TaxID=28095 RepID=UPI001FC7E4B6|nr:tail fiber domain-containing protein [Burkholderia gladioli]
MTTLQTISLGNAPDGSGGDTVRSANAKVNANTAILDACVALGYQIVSANKTLAATDAGARFGLVFQAAGGIVVLPQANSVRQNGILHFFNIGTQAVNIGFQGSDGAQITKVNAGDWVQYASDGNAYWHVVARGRLTLDEVIGGALTTVGAITSGGLLTAPNILATTIDASGSGGQLRAVQGGYGAILRNDGFAVYLMSTDKNNATGSFNALRPFWWNLVSGQVTIAGDGAKTTIGGSLTVNGQILAPEGTVQAPGISFQNDGSPDTGLFHIGDGVFGMSCNTTEVVRYSPTGASFSARPSFAGKTPWDTGNLANPMTTDTAQTVSGKKTFTQGQEIDAVGGGTNAAATLYLNGLTGYSYLGFSGFSNTVGVQLRPGSNTSASEIQAVNYNASAFATVTGAAFNQGSDAAFKDDVRTLSGVMERLRGKRAVSYVLKSSPDMGRQIGVIAQEWLDFPELLAEGPSIDESGAFIERGDSEGNSVGKPTGRPSLAYRYTNAMAVLLAGLLETDAALGEALKRIEVLEGRK